MAIEELHIVIRDAGIVLVRHTGTDWRVMQDRYPDYVTSVGPYTPVAALEWIEFERPGIHAVQAAAIAAFAAGTEDVLKLT